MLLLLPLTIGDNVTGLLIAVFGGAAASLAAGYFSRPKTKAEANKENATADVSMSGDAREWANFWAKEAKEQQERADNADATVSWLRDEIRTKDNDLATMVRHIAIIEQFVEMNGGVVPPLPATLRSAVNAAKSG